jgi:scyllo-inositol 2-dehydrogenase (NAD+)
MKQYTVGVIGTGWCGGIRAEAAANHALVDALHIAEINEDRLNEVRELTGSVSASTNWHDIVNNDEIEVVYISATPETLHYPMAKACMEAGKHVLLEKPISMTPGEADELIQLAEDKGLKFTIGYSQRFNQKQAFAKKAADEGKLGDLTSILVSRNVTRRLGNKIGGRVKMTPAAMEATHDIDFAMWLLEPRRPVRVYSQLIWGVLKESHGIADGQMIMITMDDGLPVNIQSGWSLPPGWRNFSTTQIEVIGTDGALLMDDSHKDVIFNTMDDGVQFPMSSMPGEFVGASYAGPMERETTHFLEAVAYDRPVMVEPRLARVTMDVYLAADLSAERGEPVNLPMEADDLHDALVASIGADLAAELG